jgi:hypothetical protein
VLRKNNKKNREKALSFSRIAAYSAACAYSVRESSIAAWAASKAAWDAGQLNGKVPGEKYPLNLQIRSYKAEDFLDKNSLINLLSVREKSIRYGMSLILKGVKEPKN